MKRVLFKSEPVVYLRQQSNNLSKAKMVIRAVIDTTLSNEVMIEISPYGVSPYKKIDQMCVVPPPLDLLALCQTIAGLPKIDILDEEVVCNGYHTYHELNCTFVEENDRWLVGANCGGEFLTAPMPEVVICSLEDALITCLDSCIRLDWRWFAELLLNGRVLSKRIYDALCGKFIDHNVPRRIANELIPTLPECGIDAKLLRPTAAAIKLADSTINAVALSAFHLSENIIEAVSEQSGNPVVMNTLRDWQARVVEQTGETDFASISQRHLELYSDTFPYRLRADISPQIKGWGEKSTLKVAGKIEQRTPTIFVLNDESVIETADSLQKWLAEYISTLPTKYDRDRATNAGARLTRLIADVQLAIKQGRQQKRGRAMRRLQDFCDSIGEHLAVNYSSPNKITPSDTPVVEVIAPEPVDPLPENALKQAINGRKGAPDSRVLRIVLLHGFVQKRIVGMQYTDVVNIAERIRGKGVDKGEVFECARWLLAHDILESHHPERGLIASLSIHENVKRPEPGDSIVALVRRALYLTNPK